MWDCTYNHSQYNNECIYYIVNIACWQTSIQLYLLWPILSTAEPSGNAQNETDDLEVGFDYIYFFMHSKFCTLNSGKCPSAGYLMNELCDVEIHLDNIQ